MKKYILLFSFLALASCGNSIDQKQENIKNICDSIAIGENFENIQKTFGKPELISSQKSEIWLIEVYTYGSLQTEACLVAVQNGKVETVNYHK